jgi:putative ABC transport system permease protein
LNDWISWSRPLRYALRSLARSPGFAALVIITLALGIGANTAVFSVLRGVLLRPLPHRDGDRLMYLRQSADAAGQANTLFSVPEILDYRTRARSLTGFAEFSSMPFTLLGSGEPVQVQAGIVTGNYFDVMGLRSVLGRGFDARDDGPGAEPVMMLTHEYWRRAFGADPGVVGRVFRMNGRSVTVVGVAEPAPPFPGRTDVLVNMVTSPHHLDATMVHGRSHRMTEVFARLAPGASLGQAQAELDAVAAQVHAEHRDSYDAAAGFRITISPLQEALTAPARRTLLLLMGTAALVLLTTCANVANLVLTRSVRRERELAVRWALGADRARLRRLLLAETGLLAAAGAVLGLALAWVGLDLLVAFAARFTARATEVRIDGGVLLFTMVAATGAALVFAFVPSLRAQEEAGAALTRAGTRTTGSGQRAQRALIVAQVAATVVVLAAAGLLGRTLLRLYAVDPGVRLENTLTMQVPADAEGRDARQTLGLQEEMQHRLAALPGVTDVGVGLNVPLTSGGVLLGIRAEGRPPESGVPVPMAEYRTATPEFFRAAGIPLLAGRAFEATDRPDAAPVAILNRALAERLFGAEDPVGRRVTWTGDVLRFIGMTETWRTVVGVVGDTRDDGPDAPPPPVMYQPLAQNDLAWFPGAFVIRAPRAEALAPQAERIVRDLAPDQPIVRVATLAALRDESVAPERLNAFLVGAFGLLALVIAAIGIAGVLAFFVSQRTAEIGIRMSLGAEPAAVMRMVLADGGRLLGLGIALGLAGALGVARLLDGLLFGVAPRDPLTLAGVAAVMAAVGLAACAVPARRAARVDPLEAMRAE